MRDTARSFKWALGLRCTTSAYQIFKSFGGRFRTAWPTSLIFDCCARLKTASGVPLPQHCAQTSAVYRKSHSPNGERAELFRSQAAGNIASERLPPPANSIRAGKNRISNRRTKVPLGGGAEGATDARPLGVHRNGLD